PPRASGCRIPAATLCPASSSSEADAEGKLETVGFVSGMVIDVGRIADAQQAEKRREPVEGDAGRTAQLVELEVIDVRIDIADVIEQRQLRSLAVGFETGRNGKLGLQGGQKLATVCISV